MTALGPGATADELVAFLSGRNAYPPAEGKPAVRETRTSWVFITRSRVFKLKKPISEPLMDFSTPAQRRRNAEEEVRLNRRLAPGIYLGVEPVVRTTAGRLALGGPGAPVDWLVEMKRLSEEGFLDEIIAHGRLSRPAVDALARRLAAFYAAALPEPIGPGAYVAGFRRIVLDARAILLHPALGLSRSKLDRIVGAQLRFTAAAAGPLGRRAAGGHLVEGHGDLRPEHVWLGAEPVVIDCLEFSRALRIVDPFDELAFLALECERLGAPWVGPVLLRAAEEALGGRPAPAVLAFYRAARATMRASFAMRHFLEPHPHREPAKWSGQARDYLRLAEESARALSHELR